MNTKMLKRFTLARIPLQGLVFRVFLIVFALICIYPIVFSVQTSFKTLAEFYKDIWGLPTNISTGISNYATAMVQGKVGVYFINSIMISVISLIMIELFSVLAAYALARLRIPYTEVIILFCFIIQMLPTETIIIPLYIMMSKLGLLKILYLPIALAYAGWSIPGTTIILKNYFDTIPAELVEAARIDGSNEVTTMFKIIIPLMKGAIATCIVMNFTFIWGELMWAQICTLVKSTGIPLTVGLLNFKTQFGTDWPHLCAAVTVVVIPLYVVFIFLQKYFVASLTAGGVKG